MGKHWSFGREIDFSNRTVKCPLKGKSTIYRCIVLSRAGTCRLDDDAPYKLPIDDEVCEVFDRWMGKCEYCIGVLIDKHSVIDSIFCRAKKKTY